VGQVPVFWDKWQAGMTRLHPSLDTPTKVTVCTGTLIDKWFQSHWLPTVSGIENLEVNHVTIRNEFYGAEEVTVTGLLVGQDIIDQLKGKNMGDKVIFSDRILSETDIVTLDDMTLEQISNGIGTEVVVTDDTPESFFKLLN
jgi:NifB/MoaA-like Fe-S oxidoreductase